MEENIQSAQGALADAAEGGIVESIESKILNIRGKQVMLDRDLAVLYGVETKVLNQAVKRNIERFTEDFMFQLTRKEYNDLKSQFATSSHNSKILKSQIVTSSWGGVRKMPYVFTEQGVAMLSSVLHSDRAINVNISIMRAFVMMRHSTLSVEGHEQRLIALERHQLETDQKIDHVLNCLEEGTLKEKAHIFSEGQIYEARFFIVDLISKAKMRIVLIDGYIGTQTLELLDARADGVEAEIITHSISAALQNLVDQYKLQYPNKPLRIRRWNVEQHDRWLIIDDDLWHCGASIKDVGVRTFGIDPIGLDVNVIMMQV